MVEFGKRIRFYYVFRPYQLASLHNIAEKVLHLDFANVDKLVVDKRSFKYILQGNQQVRKKFQTNGVLRKKSIYSHKLLQDIQRRDVGRWFGADNPYIWTPPDGHACMPGPPDDVVNLLLFSIFSGANMQTIN